MGGRPRIDRHGVADLAAQPGYRMTGGPSGSQPCGFLWDRWFGMLVGRAAWIRPASGWISAAGSPAETE